MITNAEDQAVCEAVTCLIPTHNRWSALSRAVASAQAQDDEVRNVVIILVVDDASTTPEYQQIASWPHRVLQEEAEYTWLQFHAHPRVPHVFHEVQWIRFKNGGSRGATGIGCAAYPRNIGLKHVQTRYVAFLDDDDAWLPHKVSTQMRAMMATGARASATDGYSGTGPYSPGKPLGALYNAQVYREEILAHRWQVQEYPEWITLHLLQKHNALVTSSVVIETELVRECGGFPIVRFAEDWALWLKVAAHCPFLYLATPCFYYDHGHAGGSHY